MYDGQEYYDVSHQETILFDFFKFYAVVHGPLSLVVISFGLPANILNIIVLTRGHMRNRFNFLLTWLAVSDTITMFIYLPFTIQFYVVNEPHSITANTEAWVYYLMFFLNVSIPIHTTSVWLGVALAVFRYVHLRANPSAVGATGMTSVKVTVFLIYAISGLFFVPIYMSNRVVALPTPDNSTLYYLLDEKTDNELFTTPTVLASLLLYSTVSKIIPCIMLTIFGWMLYRILKLRRRRTYRMREEGTLCGSRSRGMKTDVILMMIVVFFVVTELPQGVVLLVSACYPEVYSNVYLYLGDIFDIMTLANNSVNFLLYCAMSRKYRNTLKIMARSASATCKTYLCISTTNSSQCSHGVEPELTTTVAL